MPLESTFQVEEDTRVQADDSILLANGLVPSTSAAAPPRTQSLPDMAKLEAVPNADAAPEPESELADAGSFDAGDTGYDTPEELFDSVQQQPSWKCSDAQVSTVDSLQQPTFQLVPEEWGMVPLGAWQGWMLSNSMVQLPAEGLPLLAQPGGFVPSERPPGGLEEDAPKQDWSSTVTVMMRNLPKKLTQRGLLEEIDSNGFAGTYDFVYIPVDVNTKINRGYAFINFVEPKYAVAFKACYEGKRLGQATSRKLIAILPAALQGFEANHAHFASSCRAARTGPGPRPLFLREPCTASPAVEARERFSSGRLQDGGAQATPAPLPAMATEAPAAPAALAGAAAGSGGAHASSVGDGAKDSTDSPRHDRFSVNFCPFCGGKVGKDFKFCQFCGSSLEL